MIKTLVTNREWGKFSHTQVASAVKACLGRTEVAKRLLFISFAVVASFVGQTAHAQKVQTIAAWEGSTPSAANGQTVYLYNVGTKQYLGKGGRWGTEATMNVEGTPFTLTYSSGTFTLTSNVKQQGSDNKGKLTLMDGTSTHTSAHDMFNYFVDGKPKASENYTFTANGNTTDGYTLAITSASGSASSMSGKTFYMFAEGAYGHVSARLKAATSTMLGIPSDSTAYSKWVIVTENQREDAFKTVNMAHAPVVNATFLMSDFDFARKDNSCVDWKTSATATEPNSKTLTFRNDKNRKPSDAYKQGTKKYFWKTTEEHAYESWLTYIYKHDDSFESDEPIDGVGENGKDDIGKTIQHICTQANGDHSTSYPLTQKYTYKLTDVEEIGGGYTYYLGNGYDEDIYTKDPITGETLPEEIHMQELYGGAWTANIHGARGSVVQTIDGGKLVKEGWYRVSCLGFTTTTKGIARLFAAAGKGNTGSNATAQSRKFATVDLARIDAAKQPKTYVAASTLLDESTEGAYNASVMVYVGDNTTTGNKETLSFGIEVGGADDPAQDADATAWTCFDNFKIEYLGIPINKLILDEDQTDAGYIKAQTPYLENNATLQKSEVYLHRTMNPGKWNSLVLPINLNVGQVMRIFGNQVRVSEFKGAIDANHPQRIIFEPIKANQNDPDAIAIEAGKLYLVKPTADGGMPTNQEEQTLTYKDKTTKFTSYYRIVGVTFKRQNDIADDAYSGRVRGTEGNESWGESNAPQVQFVGTYVKCFDDNNQIPVNSYVLNGNNLGGTQGLWYYRTVKTKTKGFRGWLETIGDRHSKGIQYEIEGVVDQVNGDVTAIDGIEAEQQHNANIYNLNGQLVRQGATSTEGLPSGLYIVGGKKVVVK